MLQRVISIKNVGRFIPFDTYNLFYRDDLEKTRLGRLRVLAAQQAGITFDGNTINSY
jgi:hypothetical protein